VPFKKGGREKAREENGEVERKMIRGIQRRRRKERKSRELRGSEI